MKHFLAMLLALTMTIPAFATPIISLDMDPTTSGIQNTVEVEEGSTFSIDVKLDSDGYGISGFGFKLGGEALIGPPPIITGLTINPLFGTNVPDESIILESSFESGTISGAALLGEQGQFALGEDLLLATISFEAGSARGGMVFDLYDITILDTDGQSLFFLENSRSGNLRTTFATPEPETEIPEPSTALMLLTALMLMIRLNSYLEKERPSGWFCSQL